MSRLADLIYKRQNTLVPVAIFLACCAVGFRFTNHAVHWAWNDFPFIAILLILVAIIIAWIWVQMERSKFQAVIDQLNQEIKSSDQGQQQKLGELSSKQREVFDLIQQGQSNKEIMATLYIELSTLKSHINQIYKKLGITKRKEARSFLKDQ